MLLFGIYFLQTLDEKLQSEIGLPIVIDFRQCFYLLDNIQVLFDHLVTLLLFWLILSLVNEKFDCGHFFQPVFGLCWAVL